MNYESKMGKFIVFKVAEYYWALPINNVLKVINSSTLIDKELRTMGIVQLGLHIIKIVDLQPLPSGNLSQLSNTLSFLVITRNSQGELCGIAVEEPPNLIEFSLDMIRSLPKSDSYSQCFDLASHAIVFPKEQGSITIFLLDVMRIANTASIDDFHALSFEPRSALAVVPS